MIVSNPLDVTFLVLLLLAISEREGSLKMMCHLICAMSKVKSVLTLIISAADTATLYDYMNKKSGKCSSN